MQHMQAGEIHVAPIHDVYGSGFGKQHIERMDIVQFAVGYVDKAWNVAAQVEERVHLHRCLGRSEMGPRKHRETQIDGGRVERIDSAGQIHVQSVAGIQPLGLRDQPLGKLGVDPPIAGFVGVGQRGTANRPRQTHVIELGRLR